jgi:hypothetical protein
MSIIVWFNSLGASRAIETYGQEIITFADPTLDAQVHLLFHSIFGAFSQLLVSLYFHGFPLDSDLSVQPGA